MQNGLSRLREIRSAKVMSWRFCRNLPVHNSCNMPPSGLSPVLEGIPMMVRLCSTVIAFAFVLAGGLGAANAQDEDSSATQQLEETVEPNSSAGANEATSDENASYLSGGGFDSAGDTGGAGDDGSNLEPRPFEATPNE
jgi:hypothetical protein